MGVNLDKPQLWKSDVRLSVDFYNDWFLSYAPITFKNTRKKAIEEVKYTLILTKNLANYNVEILKKNPNILSVLRMCLAPPLARDRLIGLAGVSKNLIKLMEDENKIPPKLEEKEISNDLNKIIKIIDNLLDKDLFVWLEEPKNEVKDVDIDRASTVIADRLTGSQSDPLIRNAQENRQMNKVIEYLHNINYREATEIERKTWNKLPLGTYGKRINVPVKNTQGRETNIPVDIIVRNKDNKYVPLLIELKSAGDFTNVNKRRKEEGFKMSLLKQTYGDNFNYILFLCGYFDTGYLGTEAGEGIDWVWEHRVDDLKQFGIK